MRLLRCERIEVALVHQLAAVQNDKAVGEGRTQVLGQRQRLFADGEAQLIEGGGFTHWQRQRAGRATDAGGGGHGPGIAQGPAQVGQFEGVLFGHALVGGWWKALHYTQADRVTGVAGGQALAADKPQQQRRQQSFAKSKSRCGFSGDATHCCYLQALQREGSAYPLHCSPRVSRH
ncbi:hypothetical protein D3C79_843230 [compost metagenome]